jgi:hypothetical protein
VLDGHLGHLHSGSVWRYLGTHVVGQVGVVEIGIELQRGRLRLLIYTKGREVRVWRSNVASRRPGDSNGRSLWSWDQLTTTSLWQRGVWNLPRLVEVTVGAKVREDCEWRGRIMRQIVIIVCMYRELVEVVVIISTLARQLGRCWPVAQRAHAANITVFMARQPKVYQRAEIGVPCFRVSCLEHLTRIGAYAPFIHCSGLNDQTDLPVRSPYRFRRV